MGLVFFDLDRTVLDVNSGELWMRAELRLGFISRGQALRASIYLVGYHLGLLDVSSFVRAAIGTLNGERESVIRERTRVFFEAEIRARIRPGARLVLEKHRAAGDRLVLLTTSSNYLSELVSAELGLDDYLCNRFVVRGDGTFTGAPREPLCYGPGKVEIAQAFALEHGGLLSDSTFYSDSMSDRPMLEAVGHPIVVHPDPRLRQLARRRRWPIVDWGTAGLRPSSPGTGA